MQKIRRLQCKFPDQTVEIWAEDEARLGLKPIIRRVWSQRGERPLALSRTRYQWLYLHGFVQPENGDTSWMILPSVRAELMSVALRSFVEEHGNGKGKIFVVLLDRAGYHCARGVSVPPNVFLRFLPPYTPELNPAECLWPLVREAVANRMFPDLDTLEKTLIRRCRWCLRHPQTIRGRTGFQWILSAASRRNESG